jgi:hypothetical protein
MLGAYKDRTWCSRADNCATENCSRRLAHIDRRNIAELECFVAYSQFLDCEDFSVGDEEFEEGINETTGEVKWRRKALH